MAKNCYLVYRDGYLVCMTNHYKPELCDLYDHDDSDETYGDPDETEEN